MALPCARRKRAQDRGKQVLFLFITILLGSVFLGIKAIEYTTSSSHHHVPGPALPLAWALPEGADQFYSLYFAMTGLHALHMIIGIGIMTVIAVMAWRRHVRSRVLHTRWRSSGLYWHFVDIVWIFLFPPLYLIGGHFKG